MTGTDSNYYKIVQDSLTGKRAVDEETFASVAVLRERLERVKKLNAGFSRVGFSTAVKTLAKQKVALAVS